MKFRLFSQRAADRKGKKPVPLFKTFSANLRRQVVTTMSEGIGSFYDGYIGIGNEEIDTTLVWNEFDRILYKRCQAYAEHPFPRYEQPDNRIRTFMMIAKDDDFLDAMDLSVGLISTASRDIARKGWDYLIHCGVKLDPDQCLAEIDGWLREAGSVYRIAEGQIVETSDDFTHDAVVVPALQRLREPGFENAAREFDEGLQAHRDGRMGDVLTKMNHAFESTMKVIAGAFRWHYESTWTAKNLIKLVIDNGLIPPMRESALTGLRTLLESDLPTLRNKMPSAGHGAGEAQDVKIPEYVAAFAIQSSAANINLLIDSYSAKKKSKR